MLSAENHYSRIHSSARYSKGGGERVVVTVVLAKGSSRFAILLCVLSRSELVLLGKEKIERKE